jgi:hypothetical protein
VRLTGEDIDGETPAVLLSTAWAVLRSWEMGWWSTRCGTPRRRGMGGGRARWFPREVAECGRRAPGRGDSDIDVAVDLLRGKARDQSVKTRTR